jgi:hypothetical protein
MSNAFWRYLIKELTGKVERDAINEENARTRLKD